MSILSTDVPAIPPPKAVRTTASLHQSSSGRLRPARPPVWWRWLDRPLQRIALREIADNPHLLRDLGLTREQALREAARPFWR